MIIYPTPESLEHHPVVSRDQWLIARTELLKEEKGFTRLRDKINAQRRDLPWVRVEKNYVFQGPNGPQTLADLFEGRSQLLVKHFMFAPGWKTGCVGCSLDVDHIEAALVHLEHHDVTCVAVSRATLAEIEKPLSLSSRTVTTGENDSDEILTQALPADMRGYGREAAVVISAWK